MNRFDVALGRPGVPTKQIELTRENIHHLQRGDRLTVAVDYYSNGFVFREGATAVVEGVHPLQPFESSKEDLPEFSIHLSATDTFGALGRFTAGSVIKYFMLESASL